MIFNKNYNILNIHSYFSPSTIKIKSLENQNIFYLKNFQLSLQEMQKINFSNINFLSSKDYCELLNNNSNHINNDIIVEKIISENDNISIFSYILNKFNLEISSTQKFNILKKYYGLRDNSSSLLNEKLDEFDFYQKNIDDIDFINLSMNSEFFKKIDFKSKKLISSIYLEKNLKNNKKTSNKINKI